MKKFFKKLIEQEKYVLDTDGDNLPVLYDYLNAIVKLDKEGNIVSYNQVFTRQYGYNEQDLKEPFLDILLKEKAIKNWGYFDNAILGTKQIFDTTGYLKNGDQIEINITFVPIKQNNNVDVYAILKNATEFQEKKELNLLQKMRETFDEVDSICNYFYDVINDYHYFSRQFTDMLKITPEKAFTPSLNHLLRYVYPEDVDLVKNTVQTALKKRTGFQIEYRMIRKDQTIFLVQEHAEILLDENGNLNGVVGFIQDITHHNVSNALLESEAQVRGFYDNENIGFWSFEIQTGTCINSSIGIEYITGYTKEDFNSGLQWQSIVYKEDLQKYLDNQVQLARGNILQHQYRIENKNREVKWVQDYTVPILDSAGNIIRLDGLTLDITEQKEMEQKVEYLAKYDPLTKLPNRSQFIGKLENLIDEYADSNNQFAVIKLDIDGFKYINDTVGNEVGDELLKEFSKRMLSYLPPNDMFARRDGDVFLLLIDNIDSISTLKIKANEIMACLDKPFNIKEYQLYITVSAGICIYPENGVTSLELLRNASLALQNAKKRGKNNYHILSHASSIQSFKNYSIGRDLRKAVESKEMILYFQPRVDAKSNQIIGAEALIRWNHPEWGLISPHEFLTIAEENGLISEIDDWVLNEACQQIKNWKNRGIQVVPISINISAVHFMKPDWTSKVIATVQDAGIHPHNIELEITESTILSNTDMVKNSILKLKEFGIKIILDDFGTGYSSLSYLTQYPFDLIKIDKSFIRNMLYSDQDLHLTKSIIYMARGLQLRVVAEGVETIQQLNILQQQQCHEIQGYLFSHPVPANEFEALLRQKTLPPIDPVQKAKQSKRKHYRLNFPYPLESKMELVSIAGRSMKLGVSNVLIEDISVGGLRFVSNLKLPIRGDVVYRFITDLLGKSVTLNGSIVWKEEINEELLEYGIKFNSGEAELASFSTLLDSFIILLKNSENLPPYRKVTVDKYQYFK